MTSTTSTTAKPLGIRDGDPSGAQFDGWAGKPPEGDWAYILDDTCIGYNYGAPWPFRSNESGERGDEWAVKQFERRGFTLSEGCGWRSVRLAPDTAYQAWRNEYVLVYPSTQVPHMAEADVDLYVRPQGMGAVIVQCFISIDLRDMSYTLTNAGADWPPELTEQAGAKARKVGAFLAEHMARRTAGKRKIKTAYDQWTEGQR